jgi:MBG domain/Bacterial Ig-like domain (group 3)/Right handed beta helix region
MVFPSCRIVEAAWSASARRLNRGRPRLEPLEVRALLSGQPAILSAISGNGTSTETATLSAELTAGGSALQGQTVEFTLDENGSVTSVGSATTSAEGIATLTGASLAGVIPGTYSGAVGASFAGDATYDASSGSGTLTVAPIVTDQLGLASSANPSLPGELLSFGVMVMPLGDAQTPTGTIQFQIDGVNFGAAVPLADGAATSGLATSLTVGTHTITAVYSGDATFPGQTATMTQTVESPSQVTGEVYTVTSLGDTGTGSGTSGDLRYAITQADANPGSVIDFSVTGTIQLARALPSISANMTINGPGASLLTIKGGGPSSSFSVITEDGGVTASIRGLTITGGHTNTTLNGAGINTSGNLTLTDCTITGNSADKGGGGIVSYGSPTAPYPTLTMNECTVSDNTAGGFAGLGGGGIFTWRGAILSLTDCTITGNSAGTGSGGGAGIMSSGYPTTLTNCTISGNTSASYGGGLLCDVDNIKFPLNVTDCAIFGNSSGASGGGMFWAGPGKVTGCTISGNSASIDGGGIHCTDGEESDPLTLTDCILSGNEASSETGFSGGAKGGAIYNGGLAFLVVTGCTISGNSATCTLHPSEGSGGGIFNAGDLSLIDSTITGNTASFLGGGLSNAGGGYVGGYYYGGSFGPGGDSVVHGCTFSGNSATYGGGIMNAADLTVTNDLVSGNTAVRGGGFAQLTWYGGGLIVHSSEATLAACTLAGNSASTYGGAVFNEGTLDLTGCTISGNTANHDGGGLADISVPFFYPQGGEPGTEPAAADLANSTLYGNTSLYGGGICNEEAKLTLANVTVTANLSTGTRYDDAALGSASNEGDILLDNTLIARNWQGPAPGQTPGDVAATIDPNSAFNLIGDGDLLTGISNGGQGNQIGSASAGTVINADLGPLANNGGSTETVALLADSPAINSGSNALAVDPSTNQPLKSDQRGPGYARIVDGAVDIGAFEYGAILVTPTQLVASPQPPSSVVVGASFDLTVDAEDNAGNVANAFDRPVSVTIAAGPNGAQLGGTLTVTAAQGITAFSGLSLSQPGSYILSVTGGGLSGTIGPIQVVPGPAVQLELTTEPPTDVATGATFEIVVDAEDSMGFVDTSYSGSATVSLIDNPGDATLGGTLTATFQSGAAIFNNLTLNEPASGYYLQVTSGTLTPATSTGVTVGEPTSLVAVSGSGTYGGPATFTGTLMQGESPLAGELVEFTLTADGATENVGSATTGTNGVATLSGVSLADFGAGTFSGAIGVSFAGDATDGSANGNGELTVNPGQAALSFGSLSFTYNGAAQPITVATSPAGLTGVSVTYSLNGRPTSTPSAAGSYQVTASLNNPNYVASAITGTLTINPATPNPAPLATTQLATAITITGATLGASVDPQGNATTVSFAYGASSTLSSGTRATSGQSIGDGSAAVSVTAALTGLTAGTTYYYEVVATSSGGTTDGPILSFTTSKPTPTPAPAALTLLATAITNAGATLSASVNPQGSATTVSFVYGTGSTLSFGTKTTSGQSIGDGSAAASVTAALTGLTAGTTYYYEVVATSAGGTTDGPILSFTTPSTTPTPTPTPTPTMTVITSEQPVFTRKLNKKGKPTGKPILSGFTLDFGVALNAGTAQNRANYVVDTVTTKAVKHKKQTILHPIANFTVSYAAASDSVNISFPVNETFPTGGQVTVSSGLATASGGTLTGPAVFTIAKGGKHISPA